MFTVIPTDRGASDRLTQDAVLAGSGLDISFVRLELDSEAGVIEACAFADALIPAYVPLTARVPDELPRCRIVAFVATGFNSVDMAAAAERAVRLSAYSRFRHGTSMSRSSAMIRFASMPLRVPGTAVMTPISSSSRKLRMTVESARSSRPTLSLSATYCLACGSLIFLRSCILATRSPVVRMPPMPEASAWLIDIP